jgi:hypothetical protein
MHQLVSEHHPRRDRDGAVTPRMIRDRDLNSRRDGGASTRSARRRRSPQEEFRRRWVQVPGAAVARDAPRRWTLSYIAAGVFGGGKEGP